MKKNIVIIFLIIAAMIINGCKKKCRILIFNNSKESFVVLGDRKYIWKQGECLIINSFSGYVQWEKHGEKQIPFLQLKNKFNKKYKYILKYTLPTKTNSSITKLQLNKDLCIYLITNKAKFPTTPLPQPKGFPLKPSK